jgi:cellulose synthase/poly-beta-1,6-N-acetylglucosamine synthase-like glycosyltransferase
MKKEKLSIVVPVYNEEKTIKGVVSRINKTKLPLDKEIILINDGSKDNTEREIRKICKKNKKIKFISYKKNKGKGYALRLGFKKASGTIIGIQDADLEYDIRDYKKLLKPLLNKDASVVYGNRFHNQKLKKNSFYYGNRFLSFITSVIYSKKVNDMETCYKVFRKEILKKINLRSNRFDIEPEITAKILKNGHDIGEIPIKYNPRTKKQGKKIKVKDGFSALYSLIRYRFSN